MANSALARLAELQQQAASNDGVVRDKTWLIPTRAVLVNLATAGNALQRYRDVPAAVEQLNALVVQIGEDLVALGNAYSEGLARVDMRRMGATTQHLDDLEAKLQEAAVEVSRLGGD